MSRAQHSGGGWTHGYQTSIGYTFGHYREMAPDWMRYAALLNGYASQPVDGPLRYLELGCGQGLSLAQLAVAFPQGEFLGVDFNPEHVAHARAFARAAGLENLRFVEADFAELAQHWPPDWGQFEYLGLHGVLSWLAPGLRDAVVRCLAHAAAPGALVYVSYNAMPGWASGLPVQQVLRALLQQAPQRGVPQLLQQGAALLGELVQAKAQVAGALPGMASRIESFGEGSTAYLAHEYLNDHWQPLWHREVAEAMAAAKLAPVATATLAENYLPGLLPPELARIVAAQGESRGLQQTLIDLAMNQGFRRDLFGRGLRYGPRNAAMIGQVRLIARRGLNREQRKVGTAFGSLDLPQDLLDSVIEALQDGSERIATLALRGAFAGRPLTDAIQVASLLLHAGHVALCLPQSLPAARVAAFNRAVARATLDQWLPYACLQGTRSACPREVQEYELALYPLVAGSVPIEAPLLAAQLRDRLLSSGRSLLDNGEAVTDPQAQLDKARVLVDDFIANTLPDWRRLGVV